MRQRRTKAIRRPLATSFCRFQTRISCDFLDEVEELAGFAPQIIEAIEKDLDAHAREKKKLRLEDRRFFEGRTAELDIEEENILAAELNLGAGRPRMPAYAGIRVRDDSRVSGFVDHETGTAVCARVDELVRIFAERGTENAGGDDDSGEREPGQPYDPRVDL